MRGPDATLLLLGLASAACDRPEPRNGRRSIAPLPAIVALPAREGASPVRFVDATAGSGLRFVEDNGFDDVHWFYVENLGTGLILFDADGDEDLDLFFCNGRRLAGPQAEPPPRAAFYRNVGAGAFVDATDESGLGDTRYTMGVCGADYDNDGDIDLYVTCFDGPNALYRNEGRGRFTDVAAAAGVTGRPDALDSACAFVDVDADGFVDLYVGVCSDHTVKNNRQCFDSPRDDESIILRRYCNPFNYEPLPDLLFRNRGDGTFEDVSEVSGVAACVGRTLGVAFADFDDDGDQDAVVACDRTENFFLENDGKGCFTNRARENGVALTESGQTPSGMGTAIGDYDDDGRLDFVITYFESESNGLYRNLGGLEFDNRAEESGSGRPSHPLLGWGTELFDADLDGRLDWIVTNGHTQPHIAQYRPPIVGWKQPTLFLLNRGGGLFESLEAEAGEALTARRSGRGLATGDVDGDGDLDVVISPIQEAAVLLKNDSPRNGNHWLLVKTVGTASNRSAIGARVVVTAGGRTLQREIHSGQSYYSQSDLRAHFGLGAAAVVDRLEVRWPSGRRSLLNEVAADRVVEVVEPRE